MPALLETLAPGYLIASPALQDPNFDHTVILMCVHNAGGAMGLVVNRPAPFDMSDILAQMGINTKGVANQDVLLGGPVAMDSGLLLYQPDPDEFAQDDEIQVSSTLRLCPNRELLERIGRGSSPSRYHMFLGHSGWGPGQLEQEIAQGAWLPASLNLELLFDVPFGERWNRILACEGYSAGTVSSTALKS
jgi:putative transcriptional regulator